MILQAHLQKENLLIFLPHNLSKKLLKNPRGPGIQSIRFKILNCYSLSDRRFVPCKNSQLQFSNVTSMYFYNLFSILLVSTSMSQGLPELDSQRFYVSEEKLRLNDAQDFCLINRNQRLWEPKSNQAIQEVVRRLDNDEEYWIGIKRDNRNEQ